MASPTFNHAVLGETFLPGQIFVFGGFALRANSLGHLEQIDSYAPDHQVRFGNLNYTTDIHGDLILDGSGPASGAPNNHDVHDLDRQSDSIQNIAPATSPDFAPERVVPSKDGWMDPAQKPHTPRNWSQTQTPLLKGSVSPDPQTHLQQCVPDCMHLCPLNLTGLQSWSSPPRISFITHPSETC